MCLLKKLRSKKGRVDGSSRTLARPSDSLALRIRQKKEERTHEISILRIRVPVLEGASALLRGLNRVSRALFHPEIAS